MHIRNSWLNVFAPWTLALLVCVSLVGTLGCESGKKSNSLQAQLQRAASLSNPETRGTQLVKVAYKLASEGEFPRFRRSRRIRIHWTG